MKENSLEKTGRAAKEKLRIPVRGTNRKFYLTPPRPEKNRPDYYVRFEVPRALREQSGQRLPAVIFQSTGTNVLAAAKEIARDKIEKVLAGKWEEVEKTKLALECATIGDIGERYRPLPRDVKPQTAARNLRTFYLVLREQTGLENVKPLRADAVLTESGLRKWIQLRLARGAGRNLLDQERAAITINSTMAQARSVLAGKVMHLYQDLKLPALTEWHGVRRLKVDADVSYRPLPQSCIDAIEAEARLLREGRSTVAADLGIEAANQQKIYLVYLLMSRLGLRNSEAEAARWSWIERDGSAAQLVIERREDFVPKNKRRRVQEIDPELLQELDRFRALPDAWIISAPTPTERYNLTHRVLNKWLRKFMPADREKVAYELRKHAASIIVSRPESEGGGIVAAANFLGDTIAVTEKTYATFLRKIRGIRSDEISGRRAA
jgi:hypothetical protein